MDDALKSILDYEPMSHLETSVGWLAIFGITAGEEIKLLEKIADVGLEKCEPIRFVRTMASYICVREKQNGQIKKKSDGTGISEDVVARLTESDLESVAKVYVEGSPFLFKRRIEQKTEDGTIRLEFSEIEHPQKAGETYCQYLHRLEVLQNKKMRNLLDSSMKKILGAASFSVNNMENIRRTLGMAEAIRTSPTTYKMSEILKEHIETEAQAKIAPFKYLGEKLESLDGHMRRTADFLPIMNETQIGISAEIKESSQSATKLAWWAIGLNILILLVTGFGVWASFKVSELSSVQTEVKVLKQNLAEEIEKNAGLRSRVTLLEKLQSAGTRRSTQKSVSEQGK